LERSYPAQLCYSYALAVKLPQNAISRELLASDLGFHSAFRQSAFRQGGDVGLIYRKRFTLGKTTAVNVSKSGVSVSERVGPVTFNSRRGMTLRLAPGLTWRMGKRR
jgi:hypothetical protein